MKRKPVDICDEIRDENWLNLKWYFEKLLGMQFSFEVRTCWYLRWELTWLEVIFWEALRDATLIWSENRQYSWWGLGLLEVLFWEVLSYFEKFLGINFQFEVRTVGIHNENWLNLKASHFLFIFVIFVKHGYLSTYLIVICLLLPITYPCKKHAFYMIQSSVTCEGNLLPS